MAEFTKVAGKNRGDIKIYTLSTCGWCKKTKVMLNNLGVEYSYIDVDLLSSDDRNKIRAEQAGYNTKGSFPTIVINNSTVIVGYDEDKLMEIIK
jgi:glutaredoxin